MSSFSSCAYQRTLKSCHEQTLALCTAYHQVMLIAYLEPSCTENFLLHMLGHLSLQTLGLLVQVSICALDRTLMLVIHRLWSCILL